MGIKSRNVPLVYLIEVIGGMLFFLPILALYIEQNLFTMTNVALIFAVESFCIVLAEIPTGAISDLFGRRKTIIMAQVFVLIALIFLFIGGSMVNFILYAVFNGIARSLISGTISAFVYDTLKEEKKEKYFKKVFGTVLALWPLGASVGSIVGGYLAAISYSLPVVASLIPISVVLVLSFFLEEPDFEKESHKNIWKHSLNATMIVFHNKQLIVLVMAGFVMMALGESLHLMGPLFFDFKEIPIVYFGFITALIYGFSSLGHYLSHYVSERWGNKRTLIMASAVSPLLIVGATVTPIIPLIFLWTFSSVFYGLKNPIIDQMLNDEVSSSKRATVLSVNSFIGKLGLAIISPFFGYVADLYTINTAAQISAVIMLIVPLMFLLLREKKGGGSIPSDPAIYLP